MLSLKRHIRISRCTTSLLKRFLSSSVHNINNFKTEKVHGVQMAYLDVGAKENKENTTIFLHGNPTSSFLWRNVIPHVAEISRCIAPDLIGMGKSDKVPNSMYTFEDQSYYLSGLLRQIQLPGKVNLVIHDWGSALGFHWASQNSNRVKSINFMEGFVAPLTWDYFPPVATETFKNLRSSMGEEMILDNNIFVEQVLQLGIIRKLTDEEMEGYRKPFAEAGESRRPTLTFPREIPFEGEGPQSTLQRMNDYNAWLAQSADIPKLFIDADPGMLSAHMWNYVKKWPNVKVEKVKGLHFIQEDSPDEIGQAVKKFISSLS